MGLKFMSIIHNWLALSWDVDNKTIHCLQYNKYNNNWQYIGNVIIFAVPGKGFGINIFTFIENHPNNCDVNY